MKLGGVYWYGFEETEDDLSYVLSGIVKISTIIWSFKALIDCLAVAFWRCIPTRFLVQLN